MAQRLLSTQSGRSTTIFFNRLNHLQADTAKGRIGQIRHHFWCPFLVGRLQSGVDAMKGG